MQFNVLAFAVAAMATVAAAGEVTTVYACPSSSASAAGVAAPSGTVGSTGVASAPTATGSPISYATGAASLNGVSALGMIVAGGVALFL